MEINVQQAAGNASLELGEKFRAGDVDVVIRRKTAKMKGLKEIAEETKGAEDRILCDFSGCTECVLRAAWQFCIFSSCFFNSIV